MNEAPILAFDFGTHHIGVAVRPMGHANRKPFKPF